MLRGVRLVVACCALIGVTAVAQAEELLLPSSDPFYSYDGDPGDVEPGAVLRTRTVPLPVGPGTLTGTQLLYRTTGQTGQPVLGVTTIVQPANPSGNPKIVAFQNFYDALGSQCNPSYTLRGGGNPGDYGRYVDLAVINRYLAAGYTVVASDYESVDLSFGAGRQSGYTTLDGIRAAQRHLAADPAQSPVVLVGYSGGAIATEFATEAAANGYAPELDIVGVAEGGFPVDYEHSIDYVNGAQLWSRVIPMILTGLSRGYRLDLDRFLSDRGKKVMRDAQHGCLGDVEFTGTIQDLLRPEFQAYMDVPELAHLVNDSRMSVTGTPNAPMWIMQGNMDGHGDGVMVAADERELLRGYCRAGVPVQFRELPADHVSIGLAFMAAAVPFVEERFNRAAPINDCATI